MRRSFIAWNPQEPLEIASPSLIKNYTFGLEQTLLFIVRQNNATRRTSTFRIDYAMPGCSIVGVVHGKADGSRGIAFTKYFCNLTIGHNSSARDATHDFIDSLPVYELVIFV